jgi:hypothetical protein
MTLYLYQDTLSQLMTGLQILEDERKKVLKVTELFFNIFLSSVKTSVKKQRNSYEVLERLSCLYAKLVLYYFCDMYRYYSQLHNMCTVHYKGPAVFRIHEHLLYILRIHTRRSINPKNGSGSRRPISYGSCRFQILPRHCSDHLKNIGVINAGNLSNLKFFI